MAINITYLRTDENYIVSVDNVTKSDKFVPITEHHYSATKDDAFIEDVDDFGDLVLMDRIATFDRAANGNLLDSKLAFEADMDRFYNSSVEMHKTIHKRIKLDSKRLNEINKDKNLFVQIN